MRGYNRLGKFNQKTSSTPLSLKKLNSMDNYQKHQLLDNCNDNKAIQSQLLFNNQSRTANLKPIKKRIKIDKAITEHQTNRMISKSRNRNHPLLSNHFQSTSISKELYDSYQCIYKYSFIKKREKVFEPHADCDSEANEEERKELLFSQLEQQYKFITTQEPIKYKHKFHSIKVMFRYPKLEPLKKRQNELMLQKLKHKYCFKQSK